MATPVATLWSSTHSTGTISHLAAAASGLDVELRFISLRGGDHRKPDYLAINPKGEVPALQLADGTVITETPAIMTWLADMAPESGLLPAAHPQRAKALEWLAWCHFRMACDFSMAFQAKRMIGGDEAAAAKLREASAARARNALAYADSQVQSDGTLLGTGRPTAADIFLNALINFAGFLRLDIAELQRLAALRAKVAAVPAIAAALAKEAALG